LKSRDIPNLITALRIFLVVPIVWLLLQENYSGALLLFIIAGVSDGIDGLLAKNLGWTSQLGGILDPIADKLLLMGTILTLGWQGELPVWLVLLVILRDLIIVSGAVGYHYLVEPFKAKPLLVSKLNTLAQLVLVLAVVFNKGIASLPAALLVTLIYLTGVTTLWSGAAYVWQWGQQALRKGIGRGVR
jgi:cardiolipin synthase